MKCTVCWMPRPEAGFQRRPLQGSNKKIYEGIEAADVRVTVTQAQESGSQAATVL